MKSTVLIIPAVHQSAANEVANIMGWGNNNYSVPLRTIGSESTEPTHYGLHAYTSAQFEAWTTGAEPLPEAIQYAQETINQLIYSFRTDIKNREHFETVLEAHGLEHMPEPEGIDGI